jgi:hypothetical protein
MLRSLKHDEIIVEGKDGLVEQGDQRAAVAVQL